MVAAAAAAAGPKSAWLTELMCFPSTRSCCCIWTGWQRRTVFDLVISQAQTEKKNQKKDELVMPKQVFKKQSRFCQFNFIERIYGLAGPPQQLEFVTVPLAPRDLSSSFPFFSFTRQTLGLLNAFNDVCHYEHSIAAHKTVCYIHSFSFEKKGRGVGG